MRRLVCALVAGLAVGGAAQAEPVRLPHGCLALATVVSADCSVRHVARCADYRGGVSSFRTDAAGRPVERVDRALGLVAARVWRRGPVAPSAGPQADRVTARIGRFWIELEPGDALRPATPDAALRVVQIARASDGGSLEATARRLRGLKPGGRMTFGIEMARTPAAGGGAGRLLRQRAVRARNATARLFGGRRGPRERLLRIYRFAVRSEDGGVVASETRYYDPRLGAVIGRRIDGVVDGRTERWDGRPIAYLRIGDPGFGDAAADRSVAPCVRDARD